MWTALHAEYRRWRLDDVQEQARKYRESSAKAAGVGSDGWWACLTHEKLRNYEASMRRHRPESFTVPGNIENLPAYREPHRPPQNTTAPSGDESDKSSSVSVDIPEDCKEQQSKQQSRRTKARVPDPLTTHCGLLPPGMLLSDFLQPPAKPSVRSAEALYWRSFASQHSQNFGVSDCEECIYADDPSHHLDAVHALTAAVKQTAYFQSIDRMQVDLEDEGNASTSRDYFDQHLQRSLGTLQPSQPNPGHVQGIFSAPTKEDEFDKRLRASVQNIDPACVATPTAVMQAAFHLINDGTTPQTLVSSM